MAEPARLGALDAAFIALEGRNTPFVVGAVLTFDRGPLTDGGGRLDFDRLCRYIGAAIDRLPRYRQRLARVPIFGNPVWTDDVHFELGRHLRLTKLPPPGTAEALSQLMGRILSDELPADHPPWQLWVIDGSSDDRVVMVAKVHHALVDGATGVRLLAHILQATPETKLPERVAWTSEAPPPAATLMKSEIAHRASRLRSLAGADARRLVPALAALVGKAIHPASDAGINQRPSGERSFISWSMPLDDMKRLARAFGVTVNDIALATTAGALRRFFRRRGVDVAALHDFRAMVPVSTHPPDDASLSGSRVALLLVQLPVDEPDPKRRVARVNEVTRALKQESRQAEAGELLVQLSDVSSPHLLSGVLRVALWRRAFNIVVTNVPGPPVPLYLMGAELRSFCAIVNLWPGQTLGIALLSYAGRLCWGLHADRHAFPDLAALVADVSSATDELRALV